MTILGNLSKRLESNFQMLINNNLHIEIYDAFTSRVNGRFFANSEHSIYFDYDGISSNAMNKRNFRIEFNPAKVADHQKVFLKKFVLPLLSDVGFSRIDLAVDVDCAFSDYQFELFNRTKSMIFSKDGRLSTQYIGSRKSKTMYRIYDKKRQLLEKEDIVIDDELLWRLEVEIKGSTYIDELIDKGFDSLFNFRIIQYDFSNISASDECFIQSMYHSPGSFAKLSNPTKAKIRKIAKECCGNDISVCIRDEVKKNNPLILAELKGYTQNGLKTIF